MSTVVTLNGINYSIPSYNDKGWAQGTGNLSAYLVAVATALNGGGGGGGMPLIDIVSVTGTSQNVINGKTYLVATGSHAVSLNMPIPASNNWFWVKDVSNNASVNNITLIRHGTEQINGVAANKVLNISAGEWLFACDGTNWFMLRDPEALNPFKSSNQLVFTPGSFTTTLNAPAPSAARVITLPDLGVDGAVVLDHGAQTLAGAMTLTAGAVFSSTALFNGVATFAAVPVFSVVPTFSAGIGSTFMGSPGTQGILTFYSPTASRGRGRLLISDSGGSNLDAVVTLQIEGSNVSDQTVSIPANATELVGITGVQTISGTKTFTSLTMGGNITAGGFKLTGLANGSASTDSVAYGQISGLVSVITGEVKMWPTASAPTGYLFCDGSAVSRTTYSALFAVISTTWGAGDGSTTFNVPDMRSRSPVGVGTGSGLTAKALASNYGLETVTIPSITTTLANIGAPFGGSAAAQVVTDSAGVANGLYTSQAGADTLQQRSVVSNTIASQNVSSLPPTVGINFIIKV
jgi:microcystin-dependent protein